MEIDLPQRRSIVRFWNNETIVVARVTEWSTWINGDIIFRPLFSLVERCHSYLLAISFSLNIFKFGRLWSSTFVIHDLARRPHGPYDYYYTNLV